MLLFITLLYFTLSLTLPIDSTFLNYPIHHDDYTNLSRNLNNLSFFVPRPVSTSIINIIGNLGHTSYLLWQNMMSVLFFFFCVKFVNSLYETSIPRILIAVALATCIMSPHSVEFQKYTGLATNISSAVFGIVSLVFINTAKGKFKSKYFFSSCIFFFLSMLSKEDFWVPTLIYPSFAWLENKHNRQRVNPSSYFASTFTLTLIAATVIFFNHYVGSQFISSSSGTYRSDFGLVSIAKTLTVYLTQDKLTFWLVVLNFLSAILDYINRKAIFSFFAITATITLIAPYTVLPNHVFLYYSFTWQIFLTCSLVASINSQKSKRPKALLALITIFVFVYIAPDLYRHKKSVSSWYNAQSNVTKNIIKGIKLIQPQINNNSRIAIVSPPKLSPWSNNDFRYINNLIGLSPKWFIFVNESTAFYEIDFRKNIFHLNDSCRIVSDVFLFFNDDGTFAVKKDCKNIID